MEKMNLDEMKDIIREEAKKFNLKRVSIIQLEDAPLTMKGRITLVIDPGDDAWSYYTFYEAVQKIIGDFNLVHCRTANEKYNSKIVTEELIYEAS